jgi:c-di-GMP-binding flagellar brake protein YcgR
MERRRYLRVKALHPMLYCEEVRPRPRSGSTLDLSLEGVAIETHHPLTRGELLEVSIALNSRLIDFSGKVVYVQPLKGKKFKAGIRFERITKKTRHILEEYLSHVGARNQAPAWS